MSRGPEEWEDAEDLEGRLERALDAALGSDAAGAWPEIPGYELERVLGRGATGTVFRARQLALDGRPVALKLLSDGASWSDTARQRFAREVRALARLHHPGVVRILEVVERPGFLALAMDLVDGVSLDRLVDASGGRPSMGGIRRRLGEDAELPDDADLATFVARVGITACWALSAVHSAGLLHRDIKPSNLMWAHGMALITDFGLACALESEDRLASSHAGFVGSPAYAAPEQLETNAARFGPATDVFGLGATLYELLAGQPPLRREGKVVRLRRIAPWVPITLATIVDRCLEAEPALRYSSATSLADDLGRFQAGLSVRAQEARVAQRFRLWLRRHRSTAVALVSGAAIAATAVCLALLNWLWVPGHVESCTRRARERLLYPAYPELVLFHTNDAPPDLDVYERLLDDPNSSPERLPAALALYDRALLLRPGRRDLRLEREAVALALGMWRREPTSEGAPALLRAYAASRDGDPVTGEWSGFEVPSEVDPLELRAVGLLAYLIGDVTVARQVSQRVPTDDSPILAAALGMTNLVLEDWDSALFRLLPAARELQDCGWLWVRCADAALQVGEPAEARTCLERADACGSHDLYHSLERARADLALLEGDLEQAFRGYELVTSYHQGLQSLRRWALALEWSGRYGEAAAVLSLKAWIPRDGALARNAVLEWRTLDDRERVHRLAKALAQPALRTVWPSLGHWLALLPDAGLAGAAEAPSEWRPADPFEVELRESFLRRGAWRAAPDADGRVELAELTACRRLLGWPERLRRRLDDEERTTLARTALALDGWCAWWAGDVAGPRLSWLAAGALERAWWPRLEGRRPARRPDRPDALLARVEPPEDMGALYGFLAPTPDGAGVLLEALGDETSRAASVGPGAAMRVLPLPPQPRYGLAVDVAEGPASGAARYLFVDHTEGQVLLLEGPELAVVRRDRAANLGAKAGVLWVQDVDGDGERDYVVRSTFDRHQGPPDYGWVELHRARDGEVLWRWTSPRRSAEAGWSVAVTGDRDGDGVPDLAVGARNWNRAGGLFWLSARSGRMLHHVEGGAGSTLFGESVVSLQQGSPGAPTLLVASPGWVRVEGRLSLLGPAGDVCWTVRDGRIGRDTMRLPDLDGDGHEDFATGILPRRTDGPGEVSIRSGATGEEWIRLRGEHCGDCFGRSLGTGFDWDGDGRPDLAIVASYADGDGTDRGCLYVYSLERLLETAPTEVSPVPASLVVEPGAR